MADVAGNDRIHLTVDEARALGESAMRGAGFDDHWRHRFPPSNESQPP